MNKQRILLEMATALWVRDAGLHGMSVLGRVYTDLNPEGQIEYYEQAEAVYNYLDQNGLLVKEVD